ncbi:MULTISPECIES: helix-turn-helix domain-containing protein [unclassified Sphingobacterium]|uniref:helix-turn-helix domain-containing protein n=1 Tax=unclassified Sphingobacterium TaxID=2609468 RepID=UPI00104E65A9|nr:MULTISPECIES: helix-turn-helix domain-containing protein [unclassified Sphingobacterium]MCS3556416.1 AraC-like DNA-binding protein [Sphingobacterium sp. JUb21]TCR08782.1 AraC family transcriptional regulator [Sphingobacterium sp. JUb20]
MNIHNQLLFFLSALGVFNSLVLGFYFLFLKRNKVVSDLFLGLLLLSLSTRIGKSIIYNFNPQLSKTYLQIGLSACVLIGPLLYFFVKSILQKLNYSFAKYSLIFIVIAVAVFGFLFPYKDNSEVWRGIIYYAINFQWFIFIVLSIYEAKQIFMKLVTSRHQISYEETWILSIICGVFAIWLSYSLSRYTSYISGALTFSFSFYISFMLIYYAKNKTLNPVINKEKYINKIDEKLVKEIQEKINILFETRKIYTNPDLTLSILAKELNIRPQLLSQLINDNLNKSFSQFINEYRIDEAKRLLIESPQLKIDAVGFESGFNSSSTFYSSFRKITGTTPSNYQKHNFYS